MHFACSSMAEMATKLGCSPFAVEDMIAVATKRFAKRDTVQQAWVLALYSYLHASVVDDSTSDLLWNLPIFPIRSPCGDKMTVKVKLQPSGRVLGKDEYLELEMSSTASFGQIANAVQVRRQPANLLLTANPLPTANPLLTALHH